MPTNVEELLAEERALREELKRELDAEKAKLQRAETELVRLRQQSLAGAKRSASPLQVLDEQLRSVIAELPVGILVENEFRQVIATNQRFLDLFHIPGSPSVLLGSDGSNMHQSAAPLFQSSNFASRISRLVQDRVACDDESLGMTDGRRLLRSYRSIENTDSPCHLWVYREAESVAPEQTALLRAKDAAEESNEAKTRFLAMMSHEMRTPLSVIIGMTELLFEESHLSTRQRDYMARVQRNAESLRALIEDILQFSKLQAGAIQLRESTFSPSKLVSDVCDALALRADEKGIELRHQVINTPDQVTGDEQRLRQVLVNLVGNAIKFTHTGTVELTIEGINSDPIEIRYTVKDTGIGIPANMQARIFERFVRVESDQNLSRVSGTGLGLSITRALIQLMGGSPIRLVSKEGHGSSFAFDLRHKLAEDAPPPSDLVEPETLNRGRSRRILLAEDDPDSRLLLERRLRRMGYMVEAAGDGATALERAKIGRYDAIVADLSMPLLDGLALTKLLRAWEAEVGAAPVPIVMLTAHALPTFRQQAMALGIDDYISKPVGGRLLRQRLAQLLERPPCVLVVDDDDAFVDLVGLVMRRARIRVLTAKEGAAALTTARLNRVDLVLLDQSLPDATGEAVASRLRQLPGMGNVPIVAITAHDDEKVHVRLRAAGCKAVAIKPLRRDQLRHIVERFLHREDDVASSPGDIHVAVDDDVAALVPRYLTRRREDVHKLRTYLRARNFHQLELLGHQMKGSGAAYGLQAVSTCGASIERAAHAQDEQALTKAVAQLEDFLHRVAIKRSIPPPRP